MDNDSILKTDIPACGNAISNKSAVPNKKIWFCRPASMDISHLAKLKPKARQKLLWLIHKLTGLHERFSDQKWVQLYSQNIKAILGRNYSETIAEAVRLGYIEVKPTYLPGKRSKSYRLICGIEKKMDWAECTDAVLKINLIKARIRKAKDDALKIASSDLDGWLMESLKDVGFPPEYEKYEDVQTLISAEPYYTICPYNRRHTPFTRLPSKVRSTVFFRSKPSSDIAEIDIRNSQPLFLLMELEDHPPKVFHIQAQEEANLQTISTAISTAIPTPIYKTPPLCGTLFQFREDVQNGELYDKIMSELAISDRKVFKDQFFAHVLYGKTGKWAEDLPIVRAFARLYPQAWRLINEAKAVDYRDLARRMQRREADFIFNRVLLRFMGECPTARVLTVHDAIYCEKRYQYDLINIMNEEFERLGLRASLRVTNCTRGKKTACSRSVMESPTPCEDAVGAPIVAMVLQPADNHTCPTAVASLLRLAGLDPVVVGGDWMDILVMADDIGVSSADHGMKSQSCIIHQDAR
jgi:hypothetical protein